MVLTAGCARGLGWGIHLVLAHLGVNGLRGLARGAAWPLPLCPTHPGRGEPECLPLPKSVAERGRGSRPRPLPALPAPPSALGALTLLSFRSAHGGVPAGEM